MRRTERLVAVCAVAVVTAACGGGSGSSGGVSIQTALQGTWSRCEGGGGSSGLRTLVVSGTSLTSTITTYDNDTCAGTGAVFFTETGTFSLGAAVTRTVGGASVTAYEVTSTGSLSGTVYDLVYVDTAADPDRLYTGDTSGANDGSTPALRPTVLDETLFLSRGTGGGGGGGGGGSAIQTAVQGTWSRCDGGGGFSDRNTLVISGSTYASSTTSYSNDTCTGTGTAVFSETGTFSIGAAVTKTVGGASVTAYEITVNGTTSGTFYDLVYVDTAANPDRFYTGDSSGVNDGSTPALRPTVLDEAFPMFKQ